MTYSLDILSAVAVLDQDKPGWHRQIDLGDFAIFDCDRCVIGQVFPSLDPIESGFNFLRQAGRVCSLAKVSTDVFCGYTAEWKSLIAERQEADRIGETLSIPDVELDEVEGVPV